MAIIYSRYPDLNLDMDSIRMLNNNEISLNFGLIYFVTYTVYLFLNINQIDALNFIISLFQASTCFEHVCLKHVEA